MLEGSPPLAVAALVDRRQGKAVLVEASSGNPVSTEDLKRLGQPFPHFAPGTAINSPASPNRGTPQVEDLGTAELEGLSCRGRRITFEDGIVEHWHAVELDIELNVLSKMHTETDDFESRLTDFRLTDPDPSLFAPLERA